MPGTLDTSAPFQPDSARCAMSWLRYYAWNFVYLFGGLLLLILPMLCLRMWPHPDKPDPPTTITRGMCANLSELAARYPAVARDLTGLEYEGPFRWTEIRGRGTPNLHITGPIGLAAVRKWRNEPGQSLKYHFGDDPEQRERIGQEAVWFQLLPGERSYIMNVFVFPDGFTLLAIYGWPDKW